MDKWEILEKHTSINRSQFLKLLKFCLTDNNYFTYDKKYYRQTYGMPMGNPLSPTIADIVLDTLLDDIIEKLKHKDIHIKFITKYVDDLFAVINKNDEEIILETLNTYHKKIQFTIEKENCAQIPYLDMNIIRKEKHIITDWYTKPTSSGRLINFNSTQPIKMKLNTVTNFVENIMNISHEQFRNKNIHRIREILKKNDYPSHIIITTINKVLSKNTNKNKNNEMNDKNFYSVPFLPNLTESKTLKKITNNENIIIAHKSNSTLRHVFTNRKTKTDKMKTDNVVYEITCMGDENDQCKKVYVGTTRRMLSTRIAEHEADIKKGKETTGLSQHIKESGHTADFKNVKILDKEKSENKRYTLESLRIQQRLLNALNTKDDKNNTKLHYMPAINIKQ